jgi:quinol monooxygenase YgiN
MIIRIFKVTIDPNHRADFERGFFSISVESVKGREGLISCEVGKPTSGNLNDYVMITHWRDKAALVTYAGPDWKKPVVPKSMEKYSANCSVEHYELQQG